MPVYGKEFLRTLVPDDRVWDAIENQFEGQDVANTLGVEGWATLLQNDVPTLTTVDSAQDIEDWLNGLTKIGYAKIKFPTAASIASTAYKTLTERRASTYNNQVDTSNVKNSKGFWAERESKAKSSHSDDLEVSDLDSESEFPESFLRTEEKLRAEEKLKREKNSSTNIPPPVEEEIDLRVQLDLTQQELEEEIEKRKKVLAELEAAEEAQRAKLDKARLDEELKIALAPYEKPADESKHKKPADENTPLMQDSPLSDDEGDEENIARIQALEKDKKKNAAILAKMKKETKADKKEIEELKKEKEDLEAKAEKEKKLREEAEHAKKEAERITKEKEQKEAENAKKEAERKQEEERSAAEEKEREQQRIMKAVEAWEEHLKTQHAVLLKPINAAINKILQEHPSVVTQKDKQSLQDQLARVQQTLQQLLTEQMKRIRKTESTKSAFPQTKEEKGLQQQVTDQVDVLLTKIDEINNLITKAKTEKEELLKRMSETFSNPTKRENSPAAESKIKTQEELLDKLSDLLKEEPESSLEEKKHATPSPPTPPPVPPRPNVSSLPRDSAGNILSSAHGPNPAPSLSADALPEFEDIKPAPADIKPPPVPPADALPILPDIDRAPPDMKLPPHPDLRGPAADGLPPPPPEPDALAARPGPMHSPIPNLPLDVPPAGPAPHVLPPGPAPHVDLRVDYDLEEVRKNLGTIEKTLQENCNLIKHAAIRASHRENIKSIQKSYQQYYDEIKDLEIPLNQLKNDLERRAGPGKIRIGKYYNLSKKIHQVENCLDRIDEIKVAYENINSLRAQFDSHASQFASNNNSAEYKQFLSDFQIPSLPASSDFAVVSRNRMPDEEKKPIQAITKSGQIQQHFFSLPTPPGEIREQNEKRPGFSNDAYYESTVNEKDELTTELKYAGDRFNSQHRQQYSTWFSGTYDFPNIDRVRLFYHQLSDHFATFGRKGDLPSFHMSKGSQVDAEIVQLLAAAKNWSASTKHDSDIPLPNKDKVKIFRDYCKANGLDLGKPVKSLTEVTTKTRGVIYSLKIQAGKDLEDQNKTLRENKIAARRAPPTGPAKTIVRLPDAPPVVPPPPALGAGAPPHIDLSRPSASPVPPAPPAHPPSSASPLTSSAVGSVSSSASASSSSSMASGSSSAVGSAPDPDYMDAKGSEPPSPRSPGRS